jgi:hypothetical protein
MTDRMGDQKLTISNSSMEVGKTRIVIQVGNLHYVSMVAYSLFSYMYLTWNSSRHWLIIIGLLMSPLLGHMILMDYPQGEQAITYHVGPVRIGG